MVRTLYLASAPEACRGELLRLMKRAGFREEEVLPRVLSRFRVRLAEVASLRTDEELRGYRLRRADVEGPDLSRCQRASKRVVSQGSEGIVASSSVAVGETLAVFPDNLRPGSQVRPQETRVMVDLQAPWKWQ
jgi:hypothetical protein